MITALIFAGGTGKRMNTRSKPKQFLEIHGKPILMHTLDVFYHLDASMQLVLVLPVVQIEFWKELCKKHGFKLPHRIIEGGNARFYSVKNGLEAVNEPALVAVHDGVRPLVSIETITRCFEAAEKFNAAIPVVDLVDSIRQITNSTSKSVDRSAYKLVQTPQILMLLC